MEKIEIRKGNISDLEKIQEFNQKLFSFESAWHPTYVSKWPYLQGGIEYFSKRLNEDNGVVFIALVGNIMVGYLCGGWLRNYAFREEKLFADLENMYVDEDFRGKGIGDALVSEFKAWCKNNGVSVIRVEAVAQNIKAIDFYQKEGFTLHNVTMEMDLRDI